MRYNQFSYTKTPLQEQLAELQTLGYNLSLDHSDKENLRLFLEHSLVNQPDKRHAFKQMIASWESDLADFLDSTEPLSPAIFYQVTLQLLGFLPYFDYTDLDDFLTKLAFPINYREGEIISSLYHLLNTRTKTGNTLIDQLVSDGLIPEDNHYHFFNGKSLATFDTKAIHRDVVYVETPVDTDKDGLPDLIKVSILRPRITVPVPSLMTLSPYHQGVNEVASDKALHKMEGELEVKPPHQIKVNTPELSIIATSQLDDDAAGIALEKTGHMSSYTLNDYMLARGFAVIYVSGIGTVDSDGFMTSGDYQQVYAYKAVIDWLNGRAVAYTTHDRTQQITADWASGKVATTGLSYLGTMSNALATTGVDGLEVVIAEAGISSWYDYYRENGLVVSPGGYPGEDLDSLAGFTYSKALLAGDWQRHKAFYQQELQEMTRQIDRQTGDYNQFWHDRNYVTFADQVKATVVFTHGSQDWNVKPINVYQMFHALPETVDKHLFFHHGAHVYMNAWQSIDFRESMNALLCQKLLNRDNGYQLPEIIWQNNQEAQRWETLSTFGGQQQLTLALGQDQAQIQNRYPEETFTKYGKAYQTFKDDLFDGKAQAISLDLDIPEDIQINGRVHLDLKVKSSTNKGLLSVQLLEIGEKNYLKPIPGILSGTMDNGRLFKEEALRELPFSKDKHRVITKGHLNLQNRQGLLTVEAIKPEDWMTISLDLQPTLYSLKQGDKLRLLLYTTDFEHTVRDNSDYQLTVDLSDSQLSLPHS